MLSDVISLSVFIEEFIPWQIVEQYALISFKTCIQTLKGSCMQTNQGYPIFLPRVQPSRC